MNNIHRHSAGIVYDTATSSFSSSSSTNGNYTGNDMLNDANGDDGLYGSNGSLNALGEPNRTKWTTEEDEALRIAVGVSIRG